MRVRERNVQSRAEVPAQCVYTFCRCSRKGGRAMCAMIDCAWEPHCLRFEDNNAVCCPRCLEYGCIHTDGIAYAKGATITETPCERCYCPPEGGRTVCDMEPCPSAVCVDPVRKGAGCCDTCPNGNNCYYGSEIVPAGRNITNGERSCRCPDVSPMFGQPQAICF